MRLQEYQSKDLFAQYGLPVMPGKVAVTPDEAARHYDEIGGTVVVKAQVLVGGRGKAGGVKLCHSREEVRQAAEKILGMEIKGLIVGKVLVTKAADIAQEFYLSFMVERTRRGIVLIFSPSGGVDIEEVAKTEPEKIFYFDVDPLRGAWDFEIRRFALQAGVPRDALAGFVRIVQQAYRCFTGSDANLMEINPLVLTPDRRWVAVDAKVVIDDNALFRQKAFAALQEEEEGVHPLEAEARRRKLPYVKLDGDVGIIGNGAGLVMATMDLVKLCGGRPANFLDIGGGAKAEVVQNALELVLSDQQVKGIFFNVFGGITRGDEVAKGILEVKNKMAIPVPFVLRLSGTRAQEGIKLLEGSGIFAYASMEEAAKEIVRQIGG